MHDHGEGQKIHHDLQRIMGQDAAFIIETQYMLLKDSHLLDEISRKLPDFLWLDQMSGVKNGLYITNNVPAVVARANWAAIRRRSFHNRSGESKKASR